MQKIDKKQVSAHERSRKGKKTLPFKSAKGLFYVKHQRGYGAKFKKVL